jgi:low temperature requirement protein LtrA
MASEAEDNNSSFRERMESEEKLLKERNFLRNYNINFESYKRDVNDVFFKRDEDETRRLNDIAQPKIIYNNFPLILGIIFFAFGILLVMSSMDDDKTKKQNIMHGYNPAPAVTYMVQPPKYSKSKKKINKI